MDNEKIKALVQSYVDELFAHDDMSDQENIEAKNDTFVMCMAFAGHILETHCIVEKSKLKQEYEHDSEMYDLGCVVPATMGHVHKGKMELLEYLFGKKLFNEIEK